MTYSRKWLLMIQNGWLGGVIKARVDFLFFRME